MPFLIKLSIIKTLSQAAVAQSVEQRTENPCVDSSILSRGISYKMKPKDIVKQFINKVINQTNYHIINQYISPNCIIHINSKEKIIGQTHFLNHIKAVRNTYPDLYISIEDQIYENSLVVTRVTLNGTHKGKWLNITPTHKKLNIMAVNINRIEDNIIVEHWGIANSLEALIDIGALKTL